MRRGLGLGKIKNSGGKDKVPTNLIEIEIQSIKLLKKIRSFVSKLTKFL